MLKARPVSVSAARRSFGLSIAGHESDLAENSQPDRTAASVKKRWLTVAKEERVMQIVTRQKHGGCD